MMELLSNEYQAHLVDNLVAQCEKKLLHIIEQHYNRFPYIQQKDLMELLGVGYQYIKKLEARGLKRVQLDPNDRTIFYKLKDVYDLLDKYAA